MIAVPYSEHTSPRAILAAAALMAMAIAGCGGTRIPEASMPLQDIPVSRAAVGGEWRDARRLGEEGPVAIEIADGSAGGAVRFGFFDPESAGRGQVLIYAGEQRIARIRLDGRGRWRDERIELDPTSSDPIRLVADVPTPIWVGPCEVIPNGQNDPPPNILVLLIDTTRQDHMSVYGYERDTTPVMEEFAREATILTQLMPSSSWTRPSVASLFTSMHPNYHGAQTNRDVLRAGLPSLAASLGAAGYDTEGFMSNANCVPTWGFGSDFARYVYVDTYMEAEWEDDPVATELAIASIERARGRPWYRYVHFMSPHKIYAPPEPFRSKFAEDLSGLDIRTRSLQSQINLYDGEIANADFHFGRILDALRATGQYENTLIVVLSDHGEEFQDHGGSDHGHTLYEELLRVPLIIKPPRGAWTVPARFEGLVEMVDIAPTILDIVGLPAPDRFQGRSMLPQLRGAPAESRTGFAALNLGWYSLRAAKTVEHKYIRDVAQDTELWFDLNADPMEREPLDPPGAWSGTLADRVTRELVGGATGLHVMLVSDGTPREAEVTITCADCGAHSEVHEEWGTELTRSGERIEWTLNAGQVNPIPPFERPNQAAKRVYARLTLDAPMTGSVRIDVRIEGQPISPESISAGELATRLPFDGAMITPADLLASPDRYDLATIPTGFGVYVWYVAAPTALGDADVPQDLREKLEAIGYTP